MDEAVTVNGEVEQESGVVSHAAIVEVDHLSVFLGMIEPSRTDGYVALCRCPLIAVGMSVLQFGVLRVAGINLALAEESPVGFAGESLLVAHPSASGSAVAEDHCLRLYAVQNLEDARIVIVVLAVNGA